MTTVCAILLAAGRSQRMGSQKLLLPFASQTVVGHIVDQLVNSPVDHVLVVVSHDAEPVRQALAAKPVTFITNPDAHGDMLSSVRCGLRALPEDCRAVLVALGDQPAIRSGLISQMVHAFEHGKRSIVVPVHAGQRGHPILFSRLYVPEILTGYDSLGLRGLLDAHSADIDEVIIPDPSILSDMDRPEDYQRELVRHARSQPPKPDNAAEP